jgi:hypothetical protein
VHTARWLAATKTGTTYSAAIDLPPIQVASWMNADETILDHRTGPIIGSAVTVSNVLGAGFLEKVYENALAHEFRKVGLAVVQQRGVTVMYDGIIVGDYAVDLLVEESVIVS